MENAVVLREWFDRVDAGRTGNITAAQLQGALAVGNLNFPISVVQQMIRMYDFDRNGTMNFEEFLALNKFLQKVQNVFSTLDRGRGFLSLEEVYQALIKLGFSLDSPAFYTVCESFDKSKKGMIQLDEFISLCIFVQSARSYFFVSLGKLQDIMWLLAVLGNLWLGISGFSRAIWSLEIESPWIAALGNLFFHVFRYSNLLKHLITNAHTKFIGVKGMTSLAVAVIIASLLITDDFVLQPYETEISTESSPFAIALAKHLHSIGAKMYGAFWCSHCNEQKQMFGHEATKILDYVECFPNGAGKGKKMTAECAAAGLEGFPTWFINGK
ncbi:hypothetical protein ACJX0J_005505, partial [Zea mays]